MSQFSKNGLEFNNIGHGETLVWIHGLCENRHLWDNLMAQMPEHHHIAFSLPGCGLSKAWDYEFSLEEIATEIQDVLLTLNVHSYTIIGHSMGAYIGLEMLASQNNQALKGLVLMNSSAAADSIEKKENREKGIRVLLQNRELFMWEFFKNLYASQFLKENLPIVEDQYGMSKSIPTSNIINTMRALKNRKDHQETLKNSAIKKLYIAGAQDNLIPATDIENQAKYTQSAYHLIENSGHVSPIETPNQVLDVLKAWFVS